MRWLENAVGLFLMNPDGFRFLYRKDDYMKDKLLEAAKTIKDYCANDSVYHEEECPFFLGYENDNNNAKYKTIRCALNLGYTLPSNWDI